MATMYPKECREDVNRAEKSVFDKIKAGLDDKVVCYYNYDIKTKETDFTVVLPGKGVCIIEVKSWNGNDIKKVLDNDTIEYYKDGKIEEATSPLNQCKSYCHSLREKTKEELKNNIKIVPIVCFPFMTEYVYKQKRLDIVTPRERTILQDDLENIEDLQFVINKKFNNYKIKNVCDFNERKYVELCSLFENKSDVEERIQKVMPPRKAQRLFEDRNYSILTYIKKIDEELMKRYYLKWIVGTKVIFTVDNEEIKKSILKYFDDYINMDMGYLTKYGAFKISDKGIYKNRIFNFEVYTLKNTEHEESIEEFKIINGESYNNHDDELEYFDKNSGFNYKQYKIEHGVEDKNILVKAGAGTGKTYSMVSRVAFLYNIKNYTPQDVIDSVIMITFTNEAADNMRVRLKEYFTNMAILTEDVEYIRVLEYISKMKISTIDSLMKKIVQTYGKYLGVGNQIAITTEIYERRKEIHKQLEIIIKEDKYKNILSNIRKYQISSLVEDFLSMIEKKKVDLTASEKEIFASMEKGQDIFDIVFEIAKNTQQIMIEKNVEDNKSHLSNLIIYVRKILNYIKTKNVKIENRVEYVFIDEFQDTDDYTIDIVKEFYDIFNFKLFVVGDIKQSIYRFRGADDEAFDKLQNKIGNWIKNNNTKYLTLNKNYRSNSKFLEELHHMFVQWGNEIEGYKSILKYENDDRLEGVNESCNKGKKVLSELYDDSNFEKKLIKVIDEKMELLEEKYKETDKKGTIAILTRDNKQIESIRQKLKDKYTIDTDKTDNLYKMAPTIDLYRLVLGLQYHKNPKYLYSLSISNYAKTISDKVVYNNRKDRTKIINAFKNNEIIDNWYSDDKVIFEKTILGRLKREPVLRVIRHIIKETKPWERYALKFPIEERKRVALKYKRNLDLLIEKIINRSSHEYLTINNLAEYLNIMIFANQHEDERVINEKNNKHRIKCLTIHKSKGLEYDHVIIPYTNDGTTDRYGNEMVIVNGKIYFKYKKTNKNKDTQSIEIESQRYFTETKKEEVDLLKEEIRVLYVALTRAKESVTWLKNTKGSKKITWGKFLESGDSYGQ